MFRARRFPTRLRTRSARRTRDGLFDLPCWIEGPARFHRRANQYRLQNIIQNQGEREMSTTTQAPALDMNKLNAFIGQFVTDLGAAVHSGMVVIGEKLGLYKVLAHGPMGPAELAARTETDERYLRE